MKLPADTARLYTVSKKLKGGPRFDFGKFGTIDLSKLTIKHAESLVKQGFPHLQRVEPKKSKRGE